MVNNPPSVQEMQKTQVQSQGQEDPLEEEMATHSITLLKQRSLVGYSPWGHKESDMTEHWLIYSIAFVSAVWPSESAVRIHASTLF